MKKKLLIFDVDGTVWDSEKDVFLSFNHTHKENAGFEIDKGEFQKLAGMHLGKMFEIVLPEGKKELAGEYERLYKKYYIDEEHFADATDLFPGVKDTLYKFKNDGYYMAVASSKPKRILEIGTAVGYSASCFALSYVAEKYFGVADITGAYIAGVILSSLKDSDYISRKMDINSYMIFGPVFFASIGLQTDIRSINATILLFSLCFVIVGMGAKIVGCGSVARLCGFKGRDKWKIGAGMMTRGEVALIVAQRGLTVGMLEGAYFTSVILLIIISSIVTPIVLKLLYAEKGSEVKETAKV